MRRIAVLLSLLLALSALARDSRKELGVSLKFAPQEGVATTSPDLLPSTSEHPIDIRVEDSRGGDDAAKIGEGTNDDDQTFPIRAGSDVVAFVQETTRSMADAWGVQQKDASDRVLNLRLVRYFVTESNKAVGSMYTAEVKLAYALTDAKGRKLAEGSTSGEAHRYGRARSADNCNEVLSDALKESFASALSDTRMQQAWVSGKVADGAGKSEPTESVEERLRKLDELLKKGLITKAEYDKKRAEILKDL